MADARMRFGVGVAVGLAVSLVASPGRAASGLASMDASVKLQVKGCGKMVGTAPAQLTLADAGTWSLAVEGDTLTGTYAAGGKGGRTLTLAIDASSLATLQAGLRGEAGALCEAPADSATVTVRKARVKLSKANTSARLLVKAALAGGGNPLKKGKYTLKGKGPLGPVPTTTTSSTTSTSTPPSSSTTTSIVTSTTTTTTSGSSTTSTTAIAGSTTTSSSTSTSTPASSSTTTSAVSSTTSTTALGSSTTSTTTLASSTTTVSTSSTTSTTSITATGYGDCVNGGPAACMPAEACFSGVFQGDTVGVCTIPCALDEDCPAPSSGNPRVSCGPNAPACLLLCDGGETCPDGMACVAGTLCFFTAPCTPNCDGRTCGDDGCGLSCGDCASGSVCADGQCVAGDSCVGRCNTFDELASCQCDPPCLGAGDCCSDVCEPGVCDGQDLCTCVPDCTERVCGSDGCFGTCGECLNVGDACSEAGQCTAGDSCVGRCDTFDGNAACQCDVGCTIGGDCCADVCDPGVCDAANVCTCVPDCTERQCGSDGCTGSCGECLTPGDVCSPAGQCVSGTSCLGRCDTFDENALCQCDAECVTFGDCCLDMCDVGVCAGLPQCVG